MNANFRFRKRVMSCAACLLGCAILVAFSAHLAYAGEPDEASREDALGFAALMLRLISVDDSYREAYQFPDVDFDELYLGEAVLGSRTGSDDDGIEQIQYWPIVFQGETVGTLVEFVEGEGSAYQLTTASVGTGDSDAVGRAGEQESSPVFATEASELGYRSGGGGDMEPIPVMELELSEWDSPAVSSSLDEPDGERDGRARSSIMVSSAAVWKDVSLPMITQRIDGLCWAASVASVGKRMTGIAKSPDSISSNLGIPADRGGNETTVTRGLSLYTYPGSSTKINAYSKTGGLSETEIKNLLSNGIPIIALTTSTTGHHAVGVTGWTKDPPTGRFVVKVMNPATGRFELVGQRSSGGSFYLETYYGNIYTWNRASIVLPKWQKPYGNNRWAYMSQSGYRVTGWQSISGSWYYFDSSGYMLTGWQSIGGKWYYLNSTGAAATGWQKIDGYWYAFDSNCAMRRGWFKDGTTWYYLRTLNNTPAPGPEGAMLANGTWTIGGKAYRFNASGACLNP